MVNLWTDVEALARLSRSERRVERLPLGASRERGGDPAVTFPPFRGRSDFEFHVVENPARIVSGDYADGFLIGEHTLAIVMADVSGKGIPAAVLMGITRSVVRNICPYTGSPGEALTRVHKILYEAELGSMFLSIFLGYYDTRTGVLRYANAGHPLPLRIGAGGEVSSFGATTGPILGILDVAPYDELVDRLHPGETLLLYTDGVTEASTADDEFFGAERLRALLRGRSGAPVEEICRLVARSLDEFQEGRRHDDATLLALRRTAGG